MTKQGTIPFAAMICAATIALVPTLAGAAEIDCRSSSFSFPADGYHLDCERSTKQVRFGESSGATLMDIMTIASDSPRMFLTVVGLQVNATRLYFEYRSLRENFRDAFNGIEIENWNAIGNKGGYDTAEFNAEISGVLSQCIAIQRYTNHAWTGYKRQMVGIGCSPADLASIYTALSKLQAPGD